MASPKSALLGKNDVVTDLESAARVLRLESAGLHALAACLDQSFSRALDIIEAIDGRVVVTGMGKSGHIARKIASTLASTGTPALYVHPGEASHGDLGMIDQRDAVFALSYSGETPELSDLVEYTRRFKIPLIAVTGRAESALNSAADIVLQLPDSEEACPMGLAPTTSTTVMLALGDAIAVALMNRKGFTVDEFRLRHPGGQLGKRLLKVSDIMHGREDMPMVAPETVMSDVLLEMTKKSFGCVGVSADGETLAGIITDGDLRRHMSGDLVSRAAREVMTAGPRTIEPDALASEALQIMNDRKITTLFVVENDRLCGILHIHDCLRAGVA
jgi:arabinose-5-phosphate isomerase